MHVINEIPCCCSDLAEAVEEIWHPCAAVVPVPVLQDKRAARHTLHHRPLHQLCHLHAPAQRQARGTLDVPRSRSALPARQLVHDGQGGKGAGAVIRNTQGLTHIVFHYVNVHAERIDFQVNYKWTSMIFITYLSTHGTCHALLCNCACWEERFLGERITSFNTWDIPLTTSNNFCTRG